MTMWRIHAPSSSANLGPGFDVLGLALHLGITLELEPDCQQGFDLEISGESADTLPRDRSNRILSVASEIAAVPLEGGDVAALLLPRFSNRRRANRVLAGQRG